MAHRSKHRRANWTPERLEAALERKDNPAPLAPKKPQRRRVLPVSVFLRTRVYR
jgi:hypothetical protein